MRMRGAAKKAGSSVVTKIIAGGQSGGDRGGLDAAIELGIEHGGWCPKGRRAEDGVIPTAYNLVETESTAYEVRTECNVRDADGTVVFTLGKPTGGSALTIKLAKKHWKPCLHLDLTALTKAAAANKVRAWLTQEGIRVLNVAGSRESKAPGLQKRVRDIVIETLKGLS